MKSVKAAMTITEFCQWASIGRSTFYQQVKGGRIPLRKVGRKSIVRLDDAEAWLNSLPERGGSNAA